MRSTPLCAIAAAAILMPAPRARAEAPPLLPEPEAAALVQELSGELAKRNLEFLSRQHRMRGSRGYHAAAEFVVERLREYGLSDARIERIPADGEIFYGTQRSRPPWDAEFAELWELAREGDVWVPRTRWASWEAQPLSLAQDSESADVTAELVDVGEGTAAGDYAGKDVAGKLVLAAAQPELVAPLAVERFGAAGIVSYAQNQKTAWWGEDENLIRWGHVGSFPKQPTFAFMVALKTARAFRERLARGETIRMHATVRAGRRPGFYEVVTATIPGADPSLREHEIGLSCHLDHPRPGANDNASGCATILEIARAVSKLVREGKLAPLARTLRFIWPPEIEGTLALLHHRPELQTRLQAVVHLDMVGGGPATKAIFHVTRGPASLPSFVHDVAAAFAEFVNRQTGAFASTGSADYPLVAPEGGKEALLAERVEYTMGSDHEVYNEGSFRIPAIYLNDWPDRYIHTNFDSAANIDPTKLKRAGFIAAASAVILAGLRAEQAGELWSLLEAASLARTATILGRRAGLPAEEALNLTRFHCSYERAQLDSIGRFVHVPEAVGAEAARFYAGLEALVGGSEPAPAPRGEGALVFRRRPEPKGPLAVFGYDYLADRYGPERAQQLGLLGYRGLRGGGSEYAYEVLNFADGRRSAQAIRDAVAATYGPVPLELVLEYLRALESIGVVEPVE
ncbi:MAG TPA: M28 family peptidase [Acidobacteriota bacterium]